MDFDPAFLKDRYDFELSRKDALTAALTLPVGVLTGTGGLLAAMARSFSYATPLLTWFFLGILSIDVVAFIACMVMLARAYHAQTYVYLPLLADLDVAKKEFLEFNSYVANNGGEIEETFEGHLRSRIIKSADANTLSNDRRSKWLHNSRIALFSVLGLTALSVVPYVVNQVQNRPTNVAHERDRSAQPTIATSPQGAAGGQATGGSSPAAGSQPHAAPAKPTFPANRVIREGQEPGSVNRGNVNTDTKKK